MFSVMALFRMATRGIILLWWHRTHQNWWKKMGPGLSFAILLFQVCSDMVLISDLLMASCSCGPSLIRFDFCFADLQCRSWTRCAFRYFKSSVLILLCCTNKSQSVSHAKTARWDIQGGAKVTEVFYGYNSLKIDRRVLIFGSSKNKGMKRLPTKMGTFTFHELE